MVYNILSSFDAQSFRCLKAIEEMLITYNRAFNQDN